MRERDVVDRLASRVTVADGAMGTLLSARRMPAPYEYANLSQADVVRGAHEEYVRAGARLIETNTFGANRIKLAATALEDRVADINRAAVRAARSAATADVLVAGAIGPCGRALAPTGSIDPSAAAEAFREQAASLADGGVDLIMLETFHDMGELRTAYDAVRAVTDLPIIVQKVFIEDGATLAAGLPEAFASRVSEWAGVVALGANCAVGPQRMLEVIRAMASATPLVLSAMPTPGLPQRVGDEVRYAVTPEYFGRQSIALARAGAGIIGGCCGTSPAHIAAVAAAIGTMPIAVRRPSSPTIVVERKPEEVAPVDIPDHSPLLGKLGNQYVRAVELDLPRGLDVSKVIGGAESLREHGVDIVNISDGARARLRMSALAVSHLIQERTGQHVMLHFACRDRNLLAVQADLLGAHALGIRCILAVTGDPALIGDYPSATSVYDVDAIGLVRILRRLNEGVDLAGVSLGSSTAFTIGVAFDPLAPSFAKEQERLHRKAAEGAHVVLTQPIFDREVLDRAVGAASHAGIPLLFGLLPLRSARHCEFMHNEVPGIRIPDEVRSRIGTMEDADARRYGLEIAREFLAHARGITQGVYVMPPFGNHRTAETLLSILD